MPGRVSRPSKFSLVKGRLQNLEPHYRVCSCIASEQDVALQREALADLKPLETSEEMMSGGLAHRPGPQCALDMLGSGDTLAVWKLDRLGRSWRQLINTAETIHAKGAALKPITENLDTATPGGRVQFHVLGALTEFERDATGERATAGMKGMRPGRPANMQALRTE